MIWKDNCVPLRKIEEIQSAVYRDSRKLEGWLSREGYYAAPGEYQIEDESWVPFALGQHWRCGDGTTRWFRLETVIPMQWEGETVAMELDFGGEGLVRIDGEIRSALTSYVTPQEPQRNRVLLSASAKGGQRVSIEIEAGMNYMEFSRYRARGLSHIEYTLRQASIGVLDTVVESYAFDALTALKAVEAMENPMAQILSSNMMLPRDTRRWLEKASRDTYIVDRVREALARSLSAVDIGLGNQALRESIPEAAKLLREGLSDIPHLPHALITFVGQAHIDTAWHWPLKETVRKCAKTLANVVDLMDRYPEMTFAFSQPQLFLYTKEYYPKLYERVKEKVKSGQFELVGNAWVEMDTNIPSGESLVRQLLYGRQFFLEEFGKASDVYWMPDVFGYSWALPQIILRSGMKYFFTSKLVNNDTNKFPHSLFQWQGVDGTRVLAYLQKLNYNGVFGPECVDTLYSKFEEKHLCDRLMMTFGYGDGGGGPNYQMLEAGKRLASFPGLQRTELGTSQAFFQDAAGVMQSLPVWNDEMYYEFHRGTYTSQANTKKNNRKGELALRRAEILSTLAGRLTGHPYPYKDLLGAYRILLTNQFHDIIPGSSIHDVYKDADTDYARMHKAISDVENGALSALLPAISRPDRSIVVFNYLSWPRTEAVEVLCDGLTGQDWQVFSPEGEALATTTVSQEDDGVMLRFIASDVPAMGYAIYTIRPAETQQPPAVMATEQLLENEYLRVSFDDQGQIISLYDKQAGREALDLTQPSNTLIIFEDKPHGESAWNIDPEYQNKCWPLSQAESIQVVESSPVRGVLRVTRRFNQSVITQDIALYAGGRQVEFFTKADWNETEKMLKTAFHPAVLSHRAAYEIQFGAIERPTHRNTSYDEARFEVCGHKWADLSEGAYGVSLLNDCKYGYDILGNQMRLTLLRAPTYPDPTADKGRHTFTYALCPHEGDWRIGGTVRKGHQLNQPLAGVYCHTGNNGDALSRPFICVKGKSAVLDTLKCAEDSNGVIVRLYEAEGSRGPVRILLDGALGLSKVTECNLMEEDEREMPLENGELTFDILPYQIRTFRLT